MTESKWLWLLVFNVLLHIYHLSRVNYILINFYNYQFYFWFIVVSFPLAIVLFALRLAETNRTPFDEGESE